MSTRPVIMAVDDSRDALGALRDALTRRYQADYRVVTHDSADAALADLEALARAGEDVALIIADQWMPGTNGLDLLLQAHELHASAQRALLVDWGDRTASPTILRGCAFGMLENYLRKP